MVIHRQLGYVVGSVIQTLETFCFTFKTKKSKQILGNATLLVHPNPLTPLNIPCDASDFAVGGVLQQRIDNVWQPLSFFSEKLTPAETRNSAFERELLAVYATIRHFRDQKLDLTYTIMVTR